MFKFQPREQDMSLLPDGDYDAVVLKGVDKPSSKGDPMLTIFLRVYHASGEPLLVTDYLLDTASAAWKLRQFCEAAGIDYEAGELDPDTLPDRNIRVKLRIDKDKNGKFPDKNAVVRYLPPTEIGGSTRVHADRPEAPIVRDDFQVSDDDVPFGFLLASVLPVIGLLA